MRSFLLDALYKGDESHPVFTRTAKKGYDIRVRLHIFGRVSVVRVTGYDNTDDKESLTIYRDFKTFLEHWTIVKGLHEYERRLGPQSAISDSNGVTHADQTATGK